MWTVTDRLTIVIIAALIGLVVLLSVRGWCNDREGEASSIGDSLSPSYDETVSRGQGSLVSPTGDGLVQGNGRQIVQFGGRLDALLFSTPIPDIPLATSEPLPLLSIRSEDGDDGAEKLALANLVCDAFPQDRYMCTHVVWAESLSGGSDCNWRLVVYGPCWSYTRDCGLLQINEVHRDKFAALGWVMDIDCWVPERNLVVAVRIYKEQGPCAWSGYGC